MVKVKVTGDDSRKDDEGMARVSWGEAQEMQTAGAGEIQPGEERVDDSADSGPGDPAAAQHETEQLGEGAGAAGGDDLEGMTKAELEQTAKDRGVEVHSHQTKAEMIEAIRKG